VVCQLTDLMVAIVHVDKARIFIPFFCNNIDFDCVMVFADQVLHEATASGAALLPPERGLASGSQGFKPAHQQPGGAEAC
jgi:hypothetical protein